MKNKSGPLAFLTPGGATRAVGDGPSVRTADGASSPVGPRQEGPGVRDEAASIRS